MSGVSGKEKKNKSKTLKNAVLLFAVVAVLVVATAVCFSNFSKASAYKNSAQEASSSLQAVNDDISKKTELIEGKGFDDYCEKIAREKYGYAKPGEYVIYDSAYGN